MWPLHLSDVCMYIYICGEVERDIERAKRCGTLPYCCISHS